MYMYTKQESLYVHSCYKVSVLISPSGDKHTPWEQLLGQHISLEVTQSLGGIRSNILQEGRPCNTVATHTYTALWLGMAQNENSLRLLLPCPRTNPACGPSEHGDCSAACRPVTMKRSYNVWQNPSQQMIHSSLRYEQSWLLRTEYLPNTSRCTSIFTFEHACRLN